MKKMFTLGLLAAMALPVMAQDNLLADATVSTLGEPLTWSNGDASYTFQTDDLSKVLDPSNTSNIFLYPENGAINTAENQAKGAQVFYVTLPKVEAIGSISTTWEGAAADSYNIYITSELPTPAILETTPTYSASELGQYTANTAIMPENTKGQYIVFQVTEATNWGWGVKIRTITALAPMADALESFNVSPRIIPFGEPVALKVSCLNQIGTDISDQVNVTVSDNATYQDGNLTINSGSYATLTATFEESSLTQTVYAATAPTTPNVRGVAIPIYINGDDTYNDKVEFVVAWNGGATDNGKITFENGAEAYSFSDTQCIFFTNTQTTGTWNAMGIDLADHVNYKTLNLDIFSDANVTGDVNFNDGKYVSAFNLKAGDWTSIIVSLNEIDFTINNMSIRIPEADKCDVLLANIYFGNTESSGVESLGSATADEQIDVVNLQGVILKKGVKASEALDNLPKGIYIVGGKKVVK